MSQVMVQRRMVAVCDILGFRDLVLRNRLEDVVDQSLGCLQKALFHSIHQGNFPETPPMIEELRKQSSVGFAWFSDTVLLYALGDTDDDCKNVLETVGCLIFETIFLADTRIRAGVAYGETYIDSENDLYVGKAIIEAYDLQSQQEWSGGALTSSAENRIPKWVLAENILDWYLTEYPVPLKVGCSDPKPRLAIDWTRGIHSPIPFDWSKESKEPTVKDEEEKADVVRKWNNTKDFHAEVCGLCFPSNRRKGSLEL